MLSLTQGEMKQANKVCWSKKSKDFLKPKLTPELAEIIGMLVADGCIQKNYVCLWGNIYEDKEYYDNIVVPLFFKVFNKNVKIHEKKSNSVYGFYLCDKKIISFLGEYFGLKIGSKTYNTKVPNIIFNSRNDNLITSFIRGYTDCDGCLNFDKRYGKYSNFNLKYNVYPRIYIISVSNVFINQMSLLLSRVGIKHQINISKPVNDRYSIVYRIVIRGKKRLEKWMELIGFNNPVQNTRYMIWKRFGFCPTNTNLAERQKILKGQIIPYSYYSPGP